MPTNFYSEERIERRMIVILYFGTLVIMSMLLYATYANMLQFKESVTELRRYNSAVVELGGFMESVHEQQSAIRGYLLTADTAYLGTISTSRQRTARFAARLDGLLPEPSWQAQLAALRHAEERVRTSLNALLDAQGAGSIGQPTMARELVRQRAVMATFREIHVRITDAIRTMREPHIEEQRVRGFSTPIMLMLYSVLAIAATALLYWRVTRALASAEKAKEDLRSKLAELANEVSARTSIQNMLQRVLDTSPNGIITFRAVRDEQDRVVDFVHLTVNAAAITMIGRDDLVGKLLLQEMPEQKSSGIFDTYVSVVGTGIPHRQEFHNSVAGHDRWFSNHAVKLEDGIMVTTTDVTEQRRAQKVNAESSRLALTGQITRTVAHEVRNPLTNIHLALEQLHDEVEDREEVVQPFFEIIDRNVKRIGDLINGMLESSRKRELNLEICTIDEIVEHAMDQVQDRLRLKRVKGVVEVVKDLPQVLVDRELISLSIINIAINAIEAMEDEKGVLRIHAHLAGDEALLEITDNGRGIPSEGLTRLFEPFYSGRPGGLGLGLTSSRNILSSHHVQLDVRSEEGVGSTFILRFPSTVFAPGA